MLARPCSRPRRDHCDELLALAGLRDPPLHPGLLDVPLPHPLGDALLPFWRSGGEHPLEVGLRPALAPIERLALRLREPYTAS